MLGRLARRYKASSEDLLVRHELSGCLREVRERLAEVVTDHDELKDRELLRVLVMPYMRHDPVLSPAALVARMLQHEPWLADILGGVARRSGQTVDTLVDMLRAADVGRRQRLLATLRIYPELARTLSLARQETVLREDGHQLMARWQRRLSRALLCVGRHAARRGILSRAEDIFDLSVSEVVVLASRPTRAECVRPTPEWQRLLAAADGLLATPRRTARDKGVYVARYEAAVASVLELLDQQRRMAARDGLSEVERSYAEEMTRLRRRVLDLRDALTGAADEYPAAV